MKINLGTDSSNFDPNFDVIININPKPDQKITNYRRDYYLIILSALEQWNILQNFSTDLTLESAALKNARLCLFNVHVIYW